MNNNPVSPKVAAATVGAAISALVLYCMETALALDLPPHVEGAVLTLCVAAATFATGYLVVDDKRR